MAYVPQQFVRGWDSYLALSNLSDQKKVFVKNCFEKIFSQKESTVHVVITHPSSQECDLMIAPLSTVLRLMQTPSSTTTPGPMVTFGPMRQPWPIFAEGSTITLPTIPSPLCSSSGCFWRRDVRYRHIPEHSTVFWVQMYDWILEADL